MQALPTKTILLFAVLCALLCSCEARPKQKTKIKGPKPNPKPPKLNTEGLQTLPEILETLELTEYMSKFIRNGITETRLLLRLATMDYQLMSMEWDMPMDKVTALKDLAAALFIKAVVVDEVTKPGLDLRKKLKYGHIYVEDSVQSHEFTVASFGGSPPQGKLQIMKGR
jgi:hypothetical protein